MTIEELRAEAKKLGYNLIPINKKEKLLPCTCGCKRREHWGFRNDKTGKWETTMNRRQKKKWANWWRKDLYKWCRRHPCESKEIICRIEELRKE